MQTSEREDRWTAAGQRTEEKEARVSPVLSRLGSVEPITKDGYVSSVSVTQISRLKEKKTTGSLSGLLKKKQKQLLRVNS